MAVTPGACGQRMYPLQMRSLGYRAIQTQLMECAFDMLLVPRGSSSFKRSGAVRWPANNREEV